MRREKTEMAGAPYDDRNEADYRELTQRITSALQTLKADRKIPATENSLAKLSKCSRATLRNRGWPIEGLKAIKRERRQQVGISPEGASGQRSPAEIHLDDKKRLIQQLDKSRTENAILFNKLRDKEDEVIKKARVIEVLKAGNAALEKRATEVEQENARLKGNDRQKKSVVIPLSKTSVKTSTRQRSGKKERGS